MVVGVDRMSAVAKWSNQKALSTSVDNIRCPGQPVAIRAISLKGDICFSNGRNPAAKTQNLGIRIVLVKYFKFLQS